MDNHKLYQKYKKYFGIKLSKLVDMAIDSCPEEAQDIIDFLLWYSDLILIKLSNMNTQAVNAKSVYIYTYKTIAKSLGYLRVFYVNHGIDDSFDLRFEGFNQDIALYNKALKRYYKMIESRCSLRRTVN